MSESQIPLELISSFLSIVILIALLYKYFQYKKKLDVLKGLDELNKEKKLTNDDKEFIRKNFKDYRQLLHREEERLKITYPVFILIAGALIAFLTFQEAMIHFNVVVVAYIYLYISKIHTRNFVTLLQKLNKDIES